MATVKICDVCGRQADKMPFEITDEESGRVWEACSPKCAVAELPETVADSP